MLALKEALISKVIELRALSGRLKNMLIDKPSVLQNDLLLIENIVCTSSDLFVGFQILSYLN